MHLIIILRHFKLNELQKKICLNLRQKLLTHGKKTTCAINSYFSLFYFFKIFKNMHLKGRVQKDGEREGERDFLSVGSLPKRAAMAGGRSILPVSHMGPGAQRLGSSFFFFN